MRTFDFPTAKIEVVMTAGESHLHSVNSTVSQSVNGEIRRDNGGRGNGANTRKVLLSFRPIHGNGNTAAIVGLGDFLRIHFEESHTGAQYPGGETRVLNIGMKHGVQFVAADAVPLDWMEHGHLANYRRLFDHAAIHDHVGECLPTGIVNGVELACSGFLLSPILGFAAGDGNNRTTGDLGAIKSVAILTQGECFGGFEIHSDLYRRQTIGIRGGA